MKQKILIADDEKRMRILIGDFLSREGYEVIEASNGREALNHFLHETNIQLVILDIMMPLLDGWEVCKEIRGVSKVPIIMLTAKNSEIDELTGFHIGTDEYIKKPFSPSVLVARVNALMQRTYPSIQKIEKGNLKIYLDSNKIESSGIEIYLSYKEYKLLIYMIENENTILTRDQILNQVWGYMYEGTDRIVDTNMNRLRAKLQSSSKYIKTMRGFGYKFEVDK